MQNYGNQFFSSEIAALRFHRKSGQRLNTNFTKADLNIYEKHDIIIKIMTFNNETEYE